MNAFFEELTLQLKSNALIITLTLGSLFYLVRETNRKIEEANKETNRKIEEANKETNRKIIETDKKNKLSNHKLDRKLDGIGLTIHSIEAQLPESIVHIELTPSQASKTKDAGLHSLLNVLGISFPELCNEPNGSKNYFKGLNFNWKWRNQSESSVYTPFINAVSTYLSALHLKIHDVSGGQKLCNQLLYTTKLCTLRVFDEYGNKKGPVYHKGTIKGRTDLVIVDNVKMGLILTHNVRFAIEVKISLRSQAEIASGLREAMTQLLGLCGSNHFRSPPVLLTDFVNSFIVVSLQRSSSIPLRFEIAAQNFLNIASALSSAYELSIKESISADLGRENTPEGSAEDE